MASGVLVDGGDEVCVVADAPGGSRVYAQSCQSLLGRGMGVGWRAKGGLGALVVVIGRRESRVWRGAGAHQFLGAHPWRSGADKEAGLGGGGGGEYGG